MKGGALEKLVKASADRQRNEGLSLTQTAPRFIGKPGADGIATGRVVGTGQLDFVGDWRGRAVSIECKSTRHATRLDLRLIRRHQAVILRRAHERGAVAFLLVELGAGSPSPVYLAVPWPTLAPWWNAASYGGAQSIPRAALDAGSVTVPRRGNYLDLVATIRAVPSLPDVNDKEA